MNTSLITFTTTQLETVKFADKAGVYNAFATELGIKTIKKFRDQTTAVARVLSIQEDYLAEVLDIVKTETPVDAPVKVELDSDTKRQTRFDMNQIIETVIDEGKDGTIENSLHAAIVTYSVNPDENPEWKGVTAEQIVEHIVKTHKRPRSGLSVDEQYAVHNIKWFIKKGHLKIVIA